MARWRSTWGDRGERRRLLLRRLEQLCVAGHRSDHLHEHGVPFVVTPTVRDALVICGATVVIESERVHRERFGGRFHEPSRMKRRSSGAAAFSLAKLNLPCAPSASLPCAVHDADGRKERAKRQATGHTESDRHAGAGDGRASINQMIRSQRMCALRSPCMSTIFLPSSMAVRSSN